MSPTSRVLMIESYTIKLLFCLTLIIVNLHSNFGRVFVYSYALYELSKLDTNGFPMEKNDQFSLRSPRNCMVGYNITDSFVVYPCAPGMHPHLLAGASCSCIYKVKI